MALVSGTVLDENGSPTERLVRVYRRDTGAYVGAAVSDPTTGAWSVTTSYVGKHFAICHDAAGNPKIDKMVLGLPFNGTNGSTTFTDLTGKTVTRAGDTVISTAQYAPLDGNTSSAYFDGTGDYLTVPKTTAFQFTGDFTVRARVMLLSYSGDLRAIFDTGKTAGPDYYALRLDVSNANKLRAGLSTNGTAVQLSISDTTDFPLSTWQDVELSRSGSAVSLFRDGVVVASGTLSGAIYYSTAEPVCIGVSPSYGGVGFATNKWHGYIDDLLIMNGGAFHTASFTPSSTPFETNLPSATENALILDDITPA